MPKKNNKKKESKAKLVEAHDSIPKKIKFSFEYYDTSCGDYCLSCWGKDTISEALKKMKDVNSKTYHQLKAGKYTYHFGSVDWSKTIKKSGFPDKNVNRLPAFHFALIGINSGMARVFGGYERDTFYVVWFDINHEIWPTPLKNT